MSASRKRRPGADADAPVLAERRFGALVPRDSRPPARTPGEFAELFEVDERTVRRWAEKCGCPQEGSLSRPRYGPEATIWAVQYLKAKKRHHRPPKYLAPETALRLHLEESRREEGDEHYLLVPLDHDHPLREWALRRAAEGRRPWSGAAAPPDERPTPGLVFDDGEEGNDGA